MTASKSKLNRKDVREQLPLCVTMLVGVEGHHILLSRAAFAAMASMATSNGFLGRQLVGSSSEAAGRRDLVVVALGVVCG